MLSVLRACLFNRCAPWALAVAAMLGGCASAPPPPAADWHDAVLAVQDQSDTVFRSVNDLVRTSQLKRVGNLNTLKESDFQPGLQADALATWNRTFDTLAAYGAALSALLNPELAAGVGDATSQLSTSIATTARSDLLQRQPGLSTALAALSTRLTAHAAGSKAQAIMAQTDPAVAQVLQQMANMVYDDSAGQTSGVYVTVHADWMTQAAEVQAAFLSAATPDDKRAVATHYADVLQQRDAADSALLGLRGSLTDLAAAHSRAAAGGPMDTAAQIARIREETAFFKGLLSDLKPATP